MKESGPTEKQMSIEGGYLPFSPKIEVIKKKLDNFWDSLSNSHKMEVLEDINVWADKIRKNYPDYNKYEIFHVLAFSSLSSEFAHYTQEDFPGDDSVKKFLQYLEAKYNK